MSIPMITLPDGRLLAYAEYGDPAGRPVFFFHGMPGSRIWRPPFDEKTRQLGARLITVDRPGYGGSSFQPGRTFLSFVDDILALATALKLNQFAVAGHSGGAPYVAACAYQIPERLTAAGIISGMLRTGDPAELEGMMPANKMGLRVGRYLPWPVWERLMSMFYGAARQHPETLIKPNEKNTADPDNAMLALPGALENCRESVREALRPGLRGHAWEGYLHLSPPPFPLQKIDMRVYLWHGTADTDTPIGMGRAIARAIPKCEAKFYEGEGHLLLFRHWEEILTSLLDQAV